MRKWTSWCAVFFVTALCLCSTTVGSALDVEAEAVPVKIAAGTERMIYKVDEKIPISVYIRNMGEKAVEIVEPAIDKRSFFFEITLPDGKKDKMLDIYGLTLQKITLPPKKRIKFTTTFTPEASGMYRIDVRYSGYNDSVVSAEPLILHVVKPTTPH